MLRHATLRILIFTFVAAGVQSELQIVDAEKTLLWGPGLEPDEVVLPARYFFIHAVDKNGRK